MTVANNETDDLRRMTRDELRTLFLFEALNDEQLDWIAREGHVIHVEEGRVFAEGDEATCCYMLLSGTLRMCKLLQGEEVETNRSSQRGVYAGAYNAFFGDNESNTYNASMYVLEPSDFYVIDAEAMASMIGTWFPMAVHLIEGFVMGTRRSNETIGQRERLLALGSLSAGLTHELNNPAAAAVRAAATLRQRVAGMRHKLAMLADGTLDATKLHKIVAIQEDAVERVAKARDMSVMEQSDAEDDLSDWLDDHGVRDSWDVAPVLAAVGLDADWMEGVRAAVGDEYLEGAVRWLMYTIDTESLMNEIDDSVTRISTLVGAAKQYSQIDRAPYQVVDLRELLKSTLVMMSGKLDGLTIVKDFDPELPMIPAYAAELNQVWTNIIDNAVQAMNGSGTLTLRTRRDGQYVVVEIGDTGPGIPADIKTRIFEPFFTTKPIGEGTGLGLDISWRIIVKKHHGDLRVDSKPGETWFRIVLPVDPEAEIQAQGDLIS
ncbi:cyclic nucleotide-binding domain-containing protein [Kribbella antibiotica]|uniref:histidine kinase n=1 Tax=Kribbella antibiotica TaxID=190195 RepID=A0A4R4Z8X6_9ACTN|nr:ATP-binding protein [Kribbella antibiotica]TDD52652.1 cyclic nucleotide-binding domain-containing protein [Kribbella antibiotica]